MILGERHLMPSGVAVRIVEQRVPSLIELSGCCCCSGAGCCEVSRSSLARRGVDRWIAVDVQRKLRSVLCFASSLTGSVVRFMVHCARGQL